MACFLQHSPGPLNVPDKGASSVSEDFCLGAKMKISEGKIGGTGISVLVMILAIALMVTACQSSKEAERGTPPAGQGGQGTPPSGSPPGGMPPNGFGGGNPPGGSPPNGGQPTGQNGGANQKGPETFSGSYVQNGGLVTVASKTYRSEKADTSGIVVTGGGSLVGRNLKIETGGNSSSQENSSFYGLNAGILAVKGAGILLSQVEVNTAGSGANGIFANGDGSHVSIFGGSVHAAGQGGHAIMASQAGSIEAEDLVMSTSGANSGAVATDRGGGSIAVRGGSIKTSGPDSPAVYSTGSISLSGTRLESTGAEAAVIEGSNSIWLSDCELSSSKDRKWGVMIYQSMSGDANGSSGRFSMSGGSLSYSGAEGPLFYVTNGTGLIRLSGVNVSVASGLLVNAAAGRWGRSGTNGANVVLSVEKQQLLGDLMADGLSAVTIALSAGARWCGAVNSSGSAKSATVILDAESSWTMSADSRVTVLEEASGVTGSSISNIQSGGHKLYYKSSANPWLEGRTYNLPGGGTLIPY